MVDEEMSAVPDAEGVNPIHELRILAKSRGWEHVIHEDGSMQITLWGDGVNRLIAGCGWLDEEEALLLHLSSSHVIPKDRRAEVALLLTYLAEDLEGESFRISSHNHTVILECKIPGEFNQDDLFSVLQNIRHTYMMFLALVLQVVGGQEAIETHYAYRALLSFEGEA